MENGTKSNLTPVCPHHQTGILSVDFQHKLDLVVDNHQMLSDKIYRLGSIWLGLGNKSDGLETKVDRFETKVDTLAADFAPYRAETVPHHWAYG